MDLPRYGIALPASPVGDGIGPHLEALVAAGTACEQAGVELLVLDARRAGAGERRLDPFVVLGAIASQTSTLRLAGLCAADERAPSLLAKATASLDVCSDGRAVLLLSPAAGTVPAGEVLAHLGECLEVARAMLALEAPTVIGTYVGVTRAWNEPRVPGHVPPVGAVVAAGTPPGDLAGTSPDWLVLEGDLQRAAGAVELMATRSGSAPDRGEQTGALCLVGLDELGRPARPGPEARPGLQGVVVALADPLAASAGLLGDLGSLLAGKAPRTPGG